MTQGLKKLIVATLFLIVLFVGVQARYASAALYYEFPPPAADSMRGSQTVKDLVGILLIPLTGFAILCVKIGLVPALGLAALLSFVVFVGRRKLRSSRRPMIDIRV